MGGTWERDSRGWGYICIHIANSLCCTAETSTTLQSNYMPIKKKIIHELEALLSSDIESATSCNELEGKASLDFVLKNEITIMTHLFCYAGLLPFGGLESACRGCLEFRDPWWGWGRGLRVQYPLLNTVSKYQLSHHCMPAPHRTQQ